MLSVCECVRESRKRLCACFRRALFEADVLFCRFIRVPSSFHIDFLRPVPNLFPCHYLKNLIQLFRAFVTFCIAQLSGRKLSCIWCTGYWIKTKHEREGKKKRISFAAIVSNCVMWHTQWTITHNFFLTEYNYSALLFSFHLVPSQSLSISHTSQQCKRKHLSACLIISIFISVFQRSLRTNVPKTEFCAFYDQFECYLMSSIQSKPTRCDRFAQFSGLNSSTRLNKTDTTFFRYIQMYESHQEQN